MVLILNFIYSFSNSNDYKFISGKLFLRNYEKNHRLIFIYPYTFIIKDDNLKELTLIILFSQKKSFKLS